MDSLPAMHSVQQLQSLITHALNERDYCAEPRELYDPICYILQLGGKRLRPSLLLMACDLFGGNVHKALNPAIAIEVFHNFTLMHDDIMDNAPLRRGSPTVHVKWNSNIAILSGDVMLVEAYKLIMEVGDGILRDVLEIFNRTAAEVCEGQQIDMNFESTNNVTIPEYLHMIRLKTAALLAASLEIGALTGGASRTDAHHLYEFGKNIGIAFQLQDDLLDVYGDPGKFGKQVGGDIISNKKTYLLIRALEMAEGEDLKELNHWLGTSERDLQKKVEVVRSFYDKFNLKQQIIREMDKHLKEASLHLDETNASAERKKVLSDFTRSLMGREY